MQNIQVKICGITTAVDAIHAFNAGADAIGLNFYERSLRYVAPAEARAIVNGLPKKALVVGVFVNADIQSMVQIAEDLSLSAIQLHGDESPAIVEQLVDFSVIRAIRLASGVVSAEEEISRWAEVGVSTILLDAFDRRRYGGTGQRLDWQAIRDLQAAVPIILAGGLDPTNVARAIEQAGPSGVDVASGVEKLPGNKDPQLVDQFVEAARQAFRSQGS